MVVPGNRSYLHNVFKAVNNRNVKRPSPKIKYQHILVSGFLLLVFQS